MIILVVFLLVLLGLRAFDTFEQLVEDFHVVGFVAADVCHWHGWVGCVNHVSVLIA